MPSRPVESSASAAPPPREQSDYADMSDPESDRRADTESQLERKEKRRESGSTSSMVRKAMNGRKPKKNGCEAAVVPDEICSLSDDSQGGPELRDISRKRVSIV